MLQFPGEGAGGTIARAGHEPSTSRPRQVVGMTIENEAARSTRD